MTTQENITIVQTQDGPEAEVWWTCPQCKHRQADTVGPELGPFLSATCGSCGNIFDDKDLSAVDLGAWDRARNWARDSQCAWTDGEEVFRGPHQWNGGKCATCGEVE